MNSNLSEVLKAIPDFDDFMSITEDIRAINFDKMVVENEIKHRESENFKAVMNKPEYFQNGKPVPVSYYENAYKFTGLSGELLELRQRLSELSALLDQKRLQLSIYKDMIDVWRTMSSNERMASV